MKWNVQTGRFVAEFFGLRTSPETQFERETAVMDRVSQEKYGVAYSELEHNLLAQDIIRNDSNVLLVTEGILGIKRERETDKRYREEADRCKITEDY